MGGLPRWAILGRGNKGLGGFNRGTLKVDYYRQCPVGWYNVMV